MPRERCFMCQRIASRCICRLFPVPLPNRTEIAIVQHPREHRHPFGTARLAELGLRRCRRTVQWRLEEHDVDYGFARDAVLLFPGPAAPPLVPGFDLEAPSQLVVLDGTWHQARALLRDQAQLRALPRVSLVPRAPSRYRIRREPHASYISTIEAIVAALQVLEPDLLGVEGLLDAFETMIDWQLQPRGPGAARHVHRAKTRITLPRHLMMPASQIAVIYAESAGPQSRDAKGDLREPLQLCIKRLTAEEGCSQVFVTANPPLPQHLACMGLAAEALRGAPPVAAASTWLRSALHGCSALVAWNRSSLQVVAPLVPELPAVVLKAAFCNALRRPAGVLENLALDLCLERKPVANVPGRAAQRLADCEAVLRWLRGQGGW